MSKSTIFIDDNNLQYKEIILQGAKITADLLTSSLGPNGKFTVIANENAYSHNRFTRDGATIAKNISRIKDDNNEALKNIGIELIKSNCITMANKIGDGSTTAGVLTYAFLHQSLLAQKKGYTSYEIKKALDIILEVGSQYINDNKKIITSNSNELKAVAINSTHSHSDGELLYNIFSKYGPDVFIIAEESGLFETTYTYKEGFSFDGGVMSNMRNNKNITINDPFILIVNNKITSLVPYAMILNEIISKGKPLIIIADDFDPIVLRGIDANQHMLNCICIKAPGYGEHKTNFLYDVSKISEAQMNYTEINMNILGSIKTAYISSSFCSFIHDKTNTETILDLKQTLEDQLQSSTSEYEKEKLKKRIACISGSGVVIIHIGGATEEAIKENKDRFEDGIAACKGAISHGTIIGGGIDYMNIYKYINKQNNLIEILSESLLSIIKGILNNSNRSDLLYSLIKSRRYQMGFDGNNIVNLVENGICVPALVSLSALKYSMSTAKIFIDIVGIIANINEDKSQYD